MLGQSKADLSVFELTRHLGVSCPAAWPMRRLLTQAMVEREARRQLDGGPSWTATTWGERYDGVTGRVSESKRPLVIEAETGDDGLPGDAVNDLMSAFSKTALA